MGFDGIIATNTTIAGTGFVTPAAEAEAAVSRRSAEGALAGGAPTPARPRG
jgi:hypothetical protein